MDLKEIECEHESNGRPFMNTVMTFQIPYMQENVFTG